MTKLNPTHIPISLYIHLPWCLKKCPYCDFNSYPLSPHQIPEQRYLNSLLHDLKQEMPHFQGRPIHSIFIGGGTPSLFSPPFFEKLLDTIQNWLGCPQHLEITIEVNPGTLHYLDMKTMRSIGINRLSLGIQSFQENALSQLGRIHHAQQAKEAIHIAQQAGFEQLNLDLMYGLPGQTLHTAMQDLHMALSFKPSHLSWYELTLEPHTPFFESPPILPTESVLHRILKEGHDLLMQSDYTHYEVSAYCLPGSGCRHNINYWMFGDYIGIGAGAHSKVTLFPSGEIVRYHKHLLPQEYIQEQPPTRHNTILLPAEELPLEFLMNALRLVEGVPHTTFTQRTGLPFSSIADIMQQLTKLGWIADHPTQLKTTPFGQQFLNEVLTQIPDKIWRE